MGVSKNSHQNKGNENREKKEPHNFQNTLVPVRRSREDARKTYDRLSRWYDILAEGSEKRLREQGIQMLNPADGERILEIGYGTGRSIIELAKSVGTSGAVYGIDLSSKMQGTAIRRATRTSLLPRIHLSVGDAVEKLPYSQGFFHGIFMSFTLELFDTVEFESVLAECKRVLHRDGRLVVVSMDSRQTSKFNLMKQLYLWGHVHLPRLIDCRPIPTQEVLQAFGWRITAQLDESTFKIPVSIVRAEMDTDFSVPRGEK